MSTRPSSRRRNRLLERPPRPPSLGSVSVSAIPGFLLFRLQSLLSFRANKHYLFCVHHFTGSANPTFTSVTSPSWDTVWTPSEPVTVSWTGSNLENHTVSIELFKDIPLLPDVNLGCVAEGVDAASGEWKGPLVLADQSVIPPGELYYVLVRIEGKPEIFVQSADFEIKEGATSTPEVTYVTASKDGTAAPDKGLSVTAAAAAGDQSATTSDVSPTNDSPTMDEMSVELMTALGSAIGGASSETRES